MSLATSFITSMSSSLHSSLASSRMSESVTTGASSSSSSYSSATPDDLSLSLSTYPAYTEDITVAGALLKSKISRMMESLVGTPPLSPTDLKEMPTLMLKVEKVQLTDRWGGDLPTLGTVHVTTSHIIFRAEDHSKEIWLANGLIGSVERGQLTVTGCPLTIRCKHFQVLSLVIKSDKACQDLYETLLRCSRPVNIEEVFAFENRDAAESARGWSRLDWEIEYCRQGIDERWKVTDLNQDYQHCDTYPLRLFVPTAATTQTLIGSARFRSRGRLPVLTYFHKANGATICRCAQPLTGFSARCMEDERLLEQIGEANPNGNVVYLVDTRPRVNAMVNKVQGKGFEDERNYTNTRFHFFDIENIHVMRASQTKLLEGCSRARTMSDWWRAVESSGWLRHARALLECAAFVADSVARLGVSCVVHCSDGWDRTAQAVALAELMLDPFYRTIHGFQVLIEKDWLGFGHKFDDRCGHIGALNDDAAKEVSPIFAQFLDAVWQLMRQFPRAFQFSERFLIEIHEHAYSCEFGTFLGNCDKDRKDLHLAKRTQSLWTHLDARQDDFFNPFYEPTLFGVLSPVDVGASSVVVWTSLYNRFDTGILPREDEADTVLAAMEHVGVLEAHIVLLRNKVAEMKQQLGRGGNGGVMVDSGHSSSNGAPSEDGKSLTTFQRQDTTESNVFDSSASYSDDPAVCPSLRWQSLRGATNCESVKCGAEFQTAGQRRIHCHRCGKIHCRRCVRMSADDRDRVCYACLAKENGK